MLHDNAIEIVAVLIKVLWQLHQLLLLIIALVDFDLINFSIETVTR